MYKDFVKTVYTVFYSISTKRGQLIYLGANGTQKSFLSYFFLRCIDLLMIKETKMFNVQMFIFTLSYVNHMLYVRIKAFWNPLA